MGVILLCPFLPTVHWGNSLSVFGRSLRQRCCGFIHTWPWETKAASINPLPHSQKSQQVKWNFNSKTFPTSSRRDWGLSRLLGKGVAELFCHLVTDCVSPSPSDTCCSRNSLTRNFILKRCSWQDGKSRRTRSHRGLSNRQLSLKQGIYLVMKWRGDCEEKALGIMCISWEPENQGEQRSRISCGKELKD